MGRTPEEIKKGLTTCLSRGQEGHCDKCPYYDIVLESCQDVLKTETISLIQQLEAQVPRWISVEERLPEDEKDVAVIVKLQKGNWMYLTAFRMPYGGWWINRGSGLDYAEVTHWMPLPEPPEA